MGLRGADLDLIHGRDDLNNLFAFAPIQEGFEGINIILKGFPLYPHFLKIFSIFRCFKIIQIPYILDGKKFLHSFAEDPVIAKIGRGNFLQLGLLELIYQFGHIESMGLPLNPMRRIEAMGVDFLINSFEEIKGPIIGRDRLAGLIRKDFTILSVDPEVDIESVGCSSAFGADQRQALNIFRMGESAATVAAFLLSPDFAFHVRTPQRFDDLLREIRKAHPLVPDGPGGLLWSDDI